MEQHPVPQNVTTFQFRLIGDMTVKQFGYLAGGVLLGYLAYKLPLPFFFTWPMALVAILGGIGLAFVPVEERPMDIWIASFFKNVYNPTQYIWQKTRPVVKQEKPAVVPLSQPMTPAVPRAPLTPTAPRGITAPRVAVPPRETQQTKPFVPRPSVAELFERLYARPKPRVTPRPLQADKQPTATTEGRPAEAPAEQPRRPASLERIISISATTSPFQEAWERAKGWFRPVSVTPLASAPGAPHLFPSILPHSILGVPAQPNVAKPAQGKPQEDATVRQQIQKLEETVGKLQEALNEKTATQNRVLELQKQLTDILSQRETLEKEVLALRQALKKGPPAEGAFRSASVATTQAQGAPTVRVITGETAVKAGLPRLTTFPNVVTGIVKDEKGNLASGILVTVRDKNDVPLRALKTNKLGQFAASTPLPNGVYLVEIEDPRNAFLFDRVQITVNGTVMPAIEIVAKSQKQVDRDRLAREIFGDTNI